MRTSTMWRGSLALVSIALALGVSACGAGKPGTGAAAGPGTAAAAAGPGATAAGKSGKLAKHGSSAPALAARTPADELYELSPARVHIRRLGPQSLRLLAPHWSRIRESDRRILQSTLLRTMSEDNVAPFVRARLKQAVDARPDLAAAAIEWLHGPVGYEVKFAEATAWSGEKSSDGAFYASVAEVRDNRTPEVRIGRIHRLAEETDALDKTLDLTSAVGTVVARLVNVARVGEKPLPLDALEAIVTRERQRPEVAAAYTPVVMAALLVRCRDLDLQQLDGYIEFAGTETGRWYHDALAAALAAGIADASADVENVFDTNAHSNTPVAAVGGVDLDSLLVPLPSGGKVRFLTFAQGGPPSAPAIVLRYETSIPLSDTPAITREGAEVWDKVRGQLESEGARSAVLQATGSVEGWVFPFALSRKFAWTRGADGEWKAGDGGRPSATSPHREMLWSVPP